MPPGQPLIWKNPAYTCPLGGEEKLKQWASEKGETAPDDMLIPLCLCSAWQLRTLYLDALANVKEDNRTGFVRARMQLPLELVSEFGTTQNGAYTPVDKFFIMACVFVLRNRAEGVQLARFALSGRKPKGVQNQAEQLVSAAQIQKI